MKEWLDKSDAVASSLAKAYGMLGEISIIVRTNKETNTLRVICPQIDPTILAEYLRAAADQIFDGPIGVKH